MLNLFDALAMRPPVHPGGSPKEAEVKSTVEPELLQLLRLTVAMRLKGVSIDLTMIDMLLEKLPEHPDNLDSAMANIGNAIGGLTKVLDDLKNYRP